MTTARAEAWESAIQFVQADMLRVNRLITAHAGRGPRCLVCSQSGHVDWPCPPYRIAEAARARLLVPAQRAETP